MSLQCRAAWVTVAAADFERSQQFYRELLRQEPTSQIPNSYAEFQLPGLRLGIYKPRPVEAADGAINQSSAARFPNLSLCLEVQDLEAAIAHLIQIGALAVGEIISAAHGREVYVQDLDGNRLILYQPSLVE